MAIAAKSYFSGSIVGVPGIGTDIDIYETSANPKYAVGFGFTRADGNKYRYCHFGALTPAGLLSSTDVDESNLAKVENVGPTTARTRAGELLVANAIGSKYIDIAITATAQQFRGGYITIATGAGASYTYRIKGHTKTSDGVPATGYIYMDLDAPLVAAVTSTSDVIIAGNPYANVETATYNTDNVVVGSTVVGNTATYYGWVCTHGITGVLQDANIGTVGEPIHISTNTSGAVAAFSNSLISPTAIYTQPIIGYLVEAGSSADYSLVMLRIE